jgi:hypothetical protein
MRNVVSEELHLICGGFIINLDSIIHAIESGAGAIGGRGSAGGSGSPSGSAGSAGGNGVTTLNVNVNGAPGS